MSENYRVWEKDSSDIKDEVAITVEAATAGNAAVGWAHKEMAMDDQSRRIVMVEAEDGTITEWSVFSVTSPEFLANPIYTDKPCEISDAEELGKIMEAQKEAVQKELERLKEAGRVSQETMQKRIDF